MVKAYANLLAQHGSILLFGFTAVFWGNFGQSFFVGVFGKSIQEGLQLSATEYGNAYSFATIASAITVSWLGGLIDRFRLKTYALMVSAGLFVAMFAMSQAQGFYSLLASFFLLRLFGQALLPHTGVTTMARAFQARRGIAVSIATSGVPAGEVVLPLLGVSLIAWIGWQHSFLVLSASVPLLLVPILLFCLGRFGRSELGRELHAAPARAQHTSSARKVLLSDSRFWLMLPGYMAGPFLFTGIFVHQAFVVDSKGWTLELLASSFVLYGVIHWVSSMVSGMLVDRYGPIRLLPYFPLPLALALFVLAFASGTWILFVMMALLAVSVGSSPPISNSLWPEVYGSENLGAIRSLTVSIMVLATALSPVLFGFLIDQGVAITPMMAAFGVYVVLACILMAFSYPASERRAR
ncbi:MFS transporter [Gilvimarinus sp. F26214L]|uniref:MFS transporter n=1 Tax=Gilvimarinus sp. DZF01 TaxID=3461371 RepID=UPI0040467F56